MSSEQIKIGTRIGYFDGKTCKYKWAICTGKDHGKLYMESKVNGVKTAFIDNEDLVLRYTTVINSNILPSNKRYPVYNVVIKNSK